MKYTKQVLEQAVKKCYSISEVCRYINGPIAKVHGGVHNHVSAKIKEFGISTKHFKPMSELMRARKSSPTNKRTAKELLVLNRPYIAHAQQLRRALLESGRKYKCELCGNDGNWQNKQLILEVDHINGNKRDDRAKNLRLLCPNCHSQTTTYKSKNRKSKA